MSRLVLSSGLLVLLCWAVVPGAFADVSRPEARTLKKKFPKALTIGQAKDGAGGTNPLVEVPSGDRLVDLPTDLRGAGYEISWFTIDGGGGGSEGGGFRLTGTLGQADAGRLAGGDYELQGGFAAFLVPPPSEIALSATPAPVSVPEPGGLVSVAVQIANIGDTQVDIISLSDSEIGDLNGEGSCSLPQSLAVAGNYQCVYSVLFGGNAGDMPVRSLGATGSGPGGLVQADAAISVTVTDVPPALGVVKVATPRTLPAPGGDVTFAIAVANTGGVEAVTVTSLVDDVHGDLNGQGDCSVPQSLDVATTYFCQFTALVNGAPGHSEVDTVTATGVDDEGNTVLASDTATVTITDALADLAITKTDRRTFVEPGASLTYTVQVENLGPSDVQGAMVWDPLPGGLVDCQWVCLTGVCAPSGSGDLADTIDLDVGALVHYEIECGVDPEAPVLLVNTVTVEAPAGVEDVDPSNNSATDQTEVATPIFYDGFESGDLSAWSSSVGAVNEDR